MDNTDLIAKLEALEAPCRECDALIFRHLANAPAENHWFAYGEQWLSDGTAARVTASLDAAMMLVPEGHSWSLSVGGNCIAQVTDCTGGACDVPSDYDGFAATPAIALCIAALKARAATQHLQEQTNDRT